jgi:hypothetical protein
MIVLPVTQALRCPTETGGWFICAASYRERQEPVFLIYRLPPMRERHPNTSHREGDLMSKPASIVVRVVGVASFLLAGYVVLTSLPDLRRYIKISRM